MRDAINSAIEKLKKDCPSCAGDAAPNIIKALQSATYVYVNDVEQESTIQNSHFEVKGWFDTYDRMVHEEHVCSRKPDRVVVSLNIGQTVIDSRELTIEKNFKLTREGDYQVSESVKLTSKMP